MALVKKLETGGTSPVQNTQKDYSQVEKALYDDLYSMSSKEARRAKPAYDQVVALVRSGAMDKALKFNPDRTYTIDTNQLPEELKRFDWTGHNTPLEKDMLGLGVKVRGKDSHQEALTSAMSALRNYNESQTTAPTTSTTTTTSTPTTTGRTGYSKDVQNINNYVVEKHYRNVQENFAPDFNKRFQTDEERKQKVLGWANENLDDYLSDYEKNKDSYTYNNIESAKQLKTLLTDPNANKNWDNISSKAYELGWKLDDFLLPTKTPEETEKAKQTDAIKLGEEYTKKYNIAPELAVQMAYKGYKPYDVTSDNVHTKALYQRGYGFRNDQGHIALIDKHTGGFYNLEGVDQFSPLYKEGFSWTNDLDRGIQYGRGKIATQDYGDVGKELITDLPGAKVYGWQNGAVGDYLNRLTIEQNGHKRTLTKQPDGSYLDDFNRPVPKFNITGFGNTHKQIRDYHPKAKPTETGSGKIGDILTGEGSTADYLDAAALTGDVVSLAGTIPGIVGGLTSTAATLGSDILRGHSFGETAGNVAMNLGFTALALIPSAASAKLGIKGTKYAAKIAKIGNETVKAEKIITDAKTAIKIAEESKDVIKGLELTKLNKAKALVKTAENLTTTEKIAKVSKYGIPEAINIAKAPINIATKALPYAQKAFVGYGLFNAGTAARQTAYDIEQGGLGNVSIQDLRGLTHGIQAGKGLYKMAQVHAGTTKTGGETIQEATHEIKLKNVPEGSGIESKIIIPKNTKPSEIKTKIDEHFDKAITPKNTELEALKAKTNHTPEETSKIESLTKELDILRKGKSETIADNGVINKVNSFLGRNNKDYKKVSDKTRSIKTEADPHSWYGKKFQETAIKKLNKGEQKALSTLKSDEKTDAIRRQDINDKLLVRNRSNKAKEIQKLRNTPVNEKLTNKDLEAKVSQLKKVQPKSKTNKMSQDAYNKRKSELENYRNEIKKILSKKKGGILKAKQGIKTIELPELKVYAKDLSPKFKIKGLDIAPIKIKPIREAFNLPSIQTSLDNTKNGSDYNIVDQSSPFKLPNLDPVDLMNTGLYASTLNANNQKVSKDVQAYLNTPLRSLLPNQQLINFNPYGQMANEVQTDANRMGNRQANATSNMNVGNAARAEMWSRGQKAAGDLRGKGAATTAQYLQNQENADYKTRATNIGLADQNLAAIRTGQSKALMAEGMLPVAQNAALNNLLLSFQKNADVKNQKQYQTGIFNILNDPKYKSLTEEYTKLADEDNNSYKKNWQTQMAVKGVVPVAWNKSGDYTDWQTALKSSEKAMNPFSEKLRALQLGMSYSQPYSYKKGGNVTKKIEASRKLFYEAIDNVNSLLNKNSIDLSDTEKNALSSDKLFYQAIRKNNKSVSKLKK